LWELRQEILASGVPLLSLDEIRQEVQTRRGVLQTRRNLDTDVSRCRRIDRRHSGTPDVAERALAILNDPERIFVASAFVRLEVLPKAVYFQQYAEAAFYEAYFATVTVMIEISQLLVAQAYDEACRAGLACAAQ
jgi:hypothetical protein